MNKKAQDNRNEYKTIRLLEAVGYQCFRMTTSKSTFNVIAVSPSDVLFIRVKANCLPSAEEIKIMESFDCPANARKLIHVWQDKKRLPEVKVV